MDDSKQDWKRSFTRLSVSESLFLWGNMGILDSDIKQTSPKIVMVDSAYLSYLHGFDSRVSLKKDRPYVGLAVRINDKVYVIPLTSQTTQERKKKGLKKRNSLTTTFVKAAGVEISDLLHNNMIPVPKQLAQRIEIDPIKDTYLTNEYRYIRKHWVDITNKSLMIYLERYNEKSRNNKFLQSICCDFKMLEEKCDDWIKSHP
ncbi:MAG: type III toxin-antitoxin system ToxN/AbiQ family toxin [Spirochaetia bacterium]|nr:type III toxin-antitoxin system ToxN/AbiQ family toxin [Spirochaetia bacterium]MDY4210431.1 type III toxin-antitoxin system ToxN/AbiQ family toxin [Treponema sp.]